MKEDCDDPHHPCGATSQVIRSASCGSIWALAELGSGVAFKKSARNFLEGNPLLPVLKSCFLVLLY